MTRTRPWASMLMLGLTLAACSDGGPLELMDIAEFDNDALAVLLAAGDAGTAAHDEPARGAGVPLFNRLADQIPGFGGLYRTARCAIVLVLTQPTDVGEAIAIVRATIEPLVERGCPDGVRVAVARGQFTYVELQRFLKATRPLTRADDVFRVSVDYSLNRVVIIVASRAVAARVAGALPGLGVPERAVVFRLGSRADAVR